MRRFPLVTFLFLFAIVMFTGSAWSALRVDIPDEGINGQGVYIHMRSDVPVQSAMVEWNGRSFPVQVEPEGKGYSGVALVGVPLQGEQAYLPLRLYVKSASGEKEFSKKIHVVHKKYPEQHLNVKKKYVTLSQKNLDRHYGEKKKVKAALKNLEKARMWTTPFLRPIPGGVSSDFGLVRFFNGEPRNPHKGLDLRGRAGTPIKAAAEGVVKLTGNHFFSGNIAYIDHGQGIITVYCHMSKIAVKSGDHVSRGQVIGYVGKTGRVTGPHLHFGFMAQGEMIDPLPLLSAE